MSVWFPPFVVLFLAIAPLSRTPLVAADVHHCFQSDDYQDGKYGNIPEQTFFSDPEIIAPVANVLSGPADSVSPSRHMVWTPMGPKIKKMGSRVLDAFDLSLVYQGPSYDKQTLGGTVQSCNGTKYLTWWSGHERRIHMAGRYYMMDSNYNLAFNFTTVGLDDADGHEFHLTPQCTAVISAYEARPYNLEKYGIQGGFLLDSLFQEIDIVTNTLLFQWRASDHIPIESTWIWPDVVRQGHDMDRAFDFFHINSVTKDRLGHYLVSSRHTSAIYYISGDGSVLWTLGGKQSDFKDMSNGSATDFAWQHHADWTSDALDTLSLFDNHYCDYYEPDRPSRGVVLSLDYDNREVTLERNYTALAEISSIREGSVQTLHDTDGNVIVGYGEEPGYTEFSAKGTVLHDVRFGPLNLKRESADNYRALKVNWTGLPLWNPRIASGPPVVQSQSMDCALLSIDRTSKRSNPSDLSTKAADISTEPAYNSTSINGNDTSYFSWNGATEILEWHVLASNTSKVLNSTTDIWRVVPKDGFETFVRIGGAAVFIRAVAVAADGAILGATSVLDMRSGTTESATAIDSKTLEDWTVPEAEAQTRTNPVAMAKSAFVAALVLAAAFLCYYTRQKWTGMVFRCCVRTRRRKGSGSNQMLYEYEDIPVELPDLKYEDDSRSSSNSGKGRL